jgi:hypothetical protein
LVKGSLPWILEDRKDLVDKITHFTKLQRYDIIMSLKSDMSPKETADGLPIEFEDLLKYARTLAFKERPDYGFIRKMFDAILFRA